VPCDDADFMTDTLDTVETTPLSYSQRAAIAIIGSTAIFVLSCCFAENYADDRFGSDKPAISTVDTAPASPSETARPVTDQAAGFDEFAAIGG
jgi:hypothetical protein